MPEWSYVKIPLFSEEEAGARGVSLHSREPAASQHSCRGVLCVFWRYRDALAASPQAAPAGSCSGEGCRDSGLPSLAFCPHCVMA